MFGVLQFITHWAGKYDGDKLDGFTAHSYFVRHGRNVLDGNSQWVDLFLLYFDLLVEESKQTNTVEHHYNVRDLMNLYVITVVCSNNFQ